MALDLTGLRIDKELLHMTAPITFSLPGGLNHYQQVLELNDWLQGTGKDVRITTYDTLQGLMWNGGRHMIGHKVLFAEHLREAVKRARLLNDAGISISLTFNSTLSSVDVDDEDANDLLRALHSELNSVTLATEALRQYVASAYPKYKRIASICYSCARVEDYLPLFDRYDLVVAMPVLAYQPEELEKLPLDRVSFILNDSCWLFCPRKPHYDSISRCFMAGNSGAKAQILNFVGAGCHVLHDVYGPQMRARVEPGLIKRVDGIRKNFFGDVDSKTEKLGHCTPDSPPNITPKVRQNLFKMGVRNFKLEGRDLLPEQYQARVIDLFKMIVTEEL